MHYYGIFIKKVKNLYNFFKIYPAPILIEGNPSVDNTSGSGREQGVEEYFGAVQLIVVYLSK